MTVILLMINSLISVFQKNFERYKRKKDIDRVRSKRSNYLRYMQQGNTLIYYKDIKLNQKLKKRIRIGVDFELELKFNFFKFKKNLNGNENGNSFVKIKMKWSLNLNCEILRTTTHL